MATPTRSPLRSSLVSVRWPWKAKSKRKSFRNVLALPLMLTPIASQAATKLSSSMRPCLLQSRPFVHASVRQPKMVSNWPRKSAKRFAAIGSRSLKLIPTQSVIGFLVKSAQRAFRLPWKRQPSRTTQSFPKETEPSNWGSSAKCQAATVDPYLFFSACRASCKFEHPATMRLLCPDGGALGRESSLAFGCESSLVLGREASSLSPCFLALVASRSFCTVIAAPSPRWRFRVHRGSRSQMVRCCFPGTGTKHLKSS
mmetsp:Transcript_134265/g.287159  ORF Transcript_134265/g.287159 Transcript_134265/m.287159 type:complete len:256 (-) Transcript_134265:1344-2111(-)